MLRIDSLQNEKFKVWRSLCESKGIKKHQMFILSGKKLIADFLKEPLLKIVCELVCENQQSLFSEFSLSSNDAQTYSHTSPPSYVLKKELFDELDTLGTHYNLLVIEMPPIADYSDSTPTGLEIVCPVGDPSNLGAIARSCLLFGAAKLILTKESAHPFLPKSLKASSGAVLQIVLEQGPALENFSGELFVMDMHGKDITQTKLPKNMRLILGEEGQGIPERLLDQPETHKIKIPTNNKLESLNVAVAAGIACFYYSQSTSYHKV